MHFRTHPGIITSLFVLLLAACGGGGGGGDGGPASPLACLTAQEAALANQINAARVAGGKPALALDTRLVQTSRHDAEQRFTTGGLATFDFGGLYAYPTGFTGTAGPGFQSGTEFWTAILNSTDASLMTLESTVTSSDTPVHLGVGEFNEPGGTHSYAMLLGSGPGAAQTTGSCAP